MSKHINSNLKNEADNNTNEADNNTIDISYKDIYDLYNKNVQDEKECEKVTQSTYRNENYYDEHDDSNSRLAFYKEILYRDKKTSGFMMKYPHGTIITQAERSNYYRGENQIYSCSIPTLTRKLRQFKTEEDKEIYKFIANMRVGEFEIFLILFDYVWEWERKYGTVLFEALAQHYGLETNWLDITNDFNVALFFATCFFDPNEKRWKPLTKNETEKDDQTKYGMIFQRFQWQNDICSSMDIGGLYLEKEKSQIPNNVILPIGFQPFMRCHMQHGYGIKMEMEYPLQHDDTFNKLRFRQSEKLSKEVFEMMDQGRKIYPHEGLMDFQDIINQIRAATVFSDEAFDYAFEMSNYFTNKEACRTKILATEIYGKRIMIEKNTHPFHVSRQRRRQLDRQYAEFSIEKEYGIKLVTRPVAYPE